MNKQKSNNADTGTDLLFLWFATIVIWVLGTAWLSANPPQGFSLLRMFVNTIPALAVIYTLKIITDKYKKDFLKKTTNSSNEAGTETDTGAKTNIELSDRDKRMLLAKMFLKRWGFLLLISFIFLFIFPIYTLLITFVLAGLFTALAWNKLKR